MTQSILKRCGLAMLGAAMALLAAGNLSAAEYQWSVSVPGVSNAGLDPDYPRAFLWIPPNCQHVRALILSQNNMEEESILEDTGFRKTLAELGFAEVWITPTLGSIHFRFDLGADQTLNNVLKSLADASGYREIAYAPLVPIGHSAMASFGWDVAAWNPGRTLAVLSISGQWPYYKDANMNVNSSPEWGDRTVDGVPGLITKGEYEIEGNTDGWYFHLKGDSLKKYPQTVLTQVIEPGQGHFNATANKIALISLYLRKAAKYRLPTDAPADGPPTLMPIDPTKTGWLFDQWRLNQAPASPAAPVDDYQGNRDQAFWAFDEEMAKALEDFQWKQQYKPAVLVAYKQREGFTPPVPDHGMVHLKFEPQVDGVTVKLTGVLWDTVPATPKGQGSEWQGWLSEGKPAVNPGDSIPHPEGEENKITIARICGPAVQTAPDTFVLHPYRIGTRDARKSNDIWLAASYPGDDVYKPMVQQAELRFPLTNGAGQAQTITFPAIPDQSAGAGMVKLAATASSAAPISYYVREGPAEVDTNGTLTLTPLPPRTKYPVTVTVVATQWGRSVDPKLQTADPVEQIFSVTAPVAAASTAASRAGPHEIDPGALWPDDRGQFIQAHGGGITKIGDTYYWFGEDHAKDNPKGLCVISCYASKDLAHWQFRNQVVKADDPAKIGPGWILERPKVFYNAHTKKFVLYAHIDDHTYKYARMAVFVSDTIDGDYQYVKDFRPLDKESRDIGQFIDDDGIAYIIFESRPTGGFYIAKLSDDSLSVEKQIAFIHEPFEAGTLVHYGGLYYVVCSHMTGFLPNPDIYATATSLDGAWSDFKDIAPPETKTYQSQATFLLKITGSKTTSVIYLGDWWRHKDHPLDLSDARYIWMPLQIGNGELKLPKPAKWTIDVTTGETQIP